MDWTGVQLLLDRLEGHCAPALHDDRFYGWAPLPLLDFYRGMAILGEGNGRRFLDVGSGIGSKLFLARQLGFDSYGIERCAAYVRVSRQLFPDIPVDLVDAENYDDWHEFDVVYCYRPYIDPEDQDLLNAMIADSMKPGALFFSAGGPYPHGLEPVGFQVWRR